MHKHLKAVNWIIALIGVLIAVLLISIGFEYYFDLNDDVLMKDIISGVYSGRAESRNIQMLWPISAVLSALYSAFPTIPWYGILLLVFQYGSIFVICARLLNIFDDGELYGAAQAGRIAVKVLICWGFIAFFTALMLTHLVNIQYTVTVAMMASSAVVYMATSDTSGRAFEFVKSNAYTIIIIFLGFLLRSEMMLLMLPFICLTGLFIWSFEDKFLTLGNVARYLTLFFTIIGVLLVGLLINKAAYSSKDWKEFTALFDARTTLYDYEVIPEYEGNEAFYDGQNISKTCAYLFKNYDYGMNPNIDSSLMDSVAKYADSLRKDEKSFTVRFREKLRLYIYELTHGPQSTGSDFPWNLVAGLLYLTVIAVTLVQRDFWGLLRPLLLFLGRSAIWMYILMGDRAPERITHSLYFMEIAVLVANILLLYLYGSRNKSSFLRIVPSLLGVILLVFSGYLLWKNIPILSADAARREQLNAPYTELYEYTSSDTDVFYFMDVYSSVDASEKLFGPERLLTKKNIELLGGWFYKSPSHAKKLLAYNIKEPSRALLKNGVYYINDNEEPMDWIYELYKERGINVNISEIDKIGGVFTVYAIRE